MNVHPAFPGRPQKNGPSQTGPAQSGPPVRVDEKPRIGSGPSPADRVVLSDAARELQQAQANGPASGALSAARMRQVSERLAQGFYERPEVRSEVLRRLAGDPENSSQGA